MATNNELNYLGQAGTERIVAKVKALESDVANKVNTDDLGALATKDSLTASEVGALPLSGGTMTGEIAIGQGDGKGIQLGTNGRINATVGNTTTATMFGIGNGNYYLGHSGFITLMRGKNTRPSYNGNDMALYSDVTSLSSDVANKMPNVAVTASDNGKFLRVVDGAWAAASIPNAEEATF